MKKLQFGRVAGLFTSLVLGFTLAGSALALTASDIAMLQAAGIISASQAASLSASISGPVVSSGYVFATDLTVGSKGVAVTALQQALVNGGYLVMPAGVSMGTFGPLTKSAVIKYQLAMGISPAAGYVGPKTRASLNGGVSTGPVVVPSGTGLSVSLAATSPASGAVIAGQAAADLVEYTFTNRTNVPAVVTNVSLMRGGVSADTNLSSVYLFSGAVRLTDAATVSAGKITFNAGNGLFTVAPGSSMTIAVKSDIDSSTASGAIIIVSLTGVTSNVPVSALYPVSGASMTVAAVTDLAKATSTVNNTAAYNGGTIQAGSSNQTIWASNLTLSGRSVWFKSLAVKVIGSAPYSAFQNLSLYVSGIKVGSAVGVDANGMVTFDLTSSPYKIDSQRLIEVRADIVSGSSRTFSVQLQNASDLQLVDSNYNVGIPVGLNQTQTTLLWTINGTSGGSVVVNLDPSSPSDNVISGASNVLLAKYTLKAFGENVKVSSLEASSTHELQNVSLYANGIQVGSTQNVSSTSARLFNLGSSLILPAGQTVTLEVRGDLKNLDGTNASTTSNNSVTVGIFGDSANAQGMESFQTSMVPGSEKDGNALTIVSGNVSLAVNNAGFVTTVSPNTLVKIGSYTIQAGSAEDVAISNVTVGLNGASSGTTTNVSNLYVVPAGSVQSSYVTQPTLSNNFNVSFTVPMGMSKTVDVYANLGSVQGTASTSLTIFGYGVNSNTTVQKGPVFGQTVNVGSGVVSGITTVTNDVFSAAQFVVGGTTGNIAKFNIVSSGGDSVLKELYFNVTGGVDQVIVNGVYTTVSNGAATSTVNIPVASGFAGQDVVVSVKYSGVGDGFIATSGTPTSITLTGLKYSSGGTNTSTTTSKASQTMTLVAAKPTLAVASGNGTDAQGSGYKTLARVTVSSVGGPIKLNNLAVSVATSGDATVGSTLDLVDPSTSQVLATSTFSAASFDLGTGPAAGYPINGSFTFEVKANVTGTYGNSGLITTTLSTNKANFVWTDTAGNATSTGSGIVPFPSAGGVVSF